MPITTKKTTKSGAERLQKILARAGIASRRAAETLISEGRVSVNGKRVDELGARADAAVDRITVDGKPLRPTSKFRYIVLHKPIEVVTTSSDPEGRTTVLDIIGKPKERLFPVGRLDYHSSGLLLLTNDGELALRLTHPRYGIRKIYRAKVDAVPTAESLRRLERGVYLEEGRTAPAEVRMVSERAGKAWIEIAVTEGRRREIRRMCLQVGLPVEKLRRIALGPLQLGKLAPGAFREITERELGALRRAVGLAPAKAAPRSSRR